VKGHTPTPWKAGENSLGVYPIYAEQGPLTVQPAKAFSDADADFIVKAVNNYELLILSLHDACIQLEYLQKFKPLGTTAGVLSRIYHLLSTVGENK